MAGDLSTLNEHMVSFGLILVHRCMTHQELDELSLIKINSFKLDLNLHSGQ